MTHHARHVIVDARLSADPRSLENRKTGKPIPRCAAAAPPDDVLADQRLPDIVRARSAGIR
jgi:hypothetical protein